MLKQRIIRSLSLWLIRRSDLFDETWYRKNSGFREEGDAAGHYYDGGWRSTNPSLRFRQEDYLKANPDVKAAGLCPLSHYLLYGRMEKRRLVLNGPNSRYHRYSFYRGVKRTFFEMINHRLIRKNQHVRILVICHVFYEESCKEILEYIKNLRCYQFDLVITTTEERDAEYIRNVFLRYKQDTELEVYPNCGFDIFPYLETIEKRRKKEYDVVIKAQSKRLFDKDGVIAATMFVRGRDWFLYLFESILSAKYVHKNINRLVNDPSIHLVAAQNLLMKDPTHKRNMTQRKLNQMGLTLPIEYVFAAGTCFAMKASTVWAKHLGLLDHCTFEKTERNYFSAAHAMERYLTGIVPREAQLGNRVCTLRRIMDEIKGRKKLSVCGLRVVNESGLTFDDDFVLRFLEYTPVFHYEMIQMPVKDLCINPDNQRIPLNQCAPYRYLQGDKEQYIEYCLTHRRTDYMELSEEEFRQEVLRNGIQRFERLIENLDQHGYDIDKPIVIDQDGVILDGQHRACWYMNRYGTDSMIQVFQLQIKPDNLGR